MYNKQIINILNNFIKDIDINDVKIRNIVRNFILYISDLDPTLNGDNVGHIIDLILKDNNVILYDNNKGLFIITYKELKYLLERYNSNIKMFRGERNINGKIIKGINDFNNFNEFKNKVNEILGIERNVYEYEDYKYSYIIYKDSKWEIIAIYDEEELKKITEGTSWCVNKSSESSNVYMQNPPLYLIKKNGNKYGSLHFEKIELRYIYNKEFNKEEEEEIIRFLIKIKLFSKYDITKLLIDRGFIDKDGYEYYLEYAYNNKYENSCFSYNAVKNGGLKDEVDKNKLINITLRSPKYTKELLRNKIILKDSGEIYYKIVSKFLRDDKFLTEEDDDIKSKEELYDFINNHDEDRRLNLNLLYHKVINRKDDEEMFYRLIRNEHTAILMQLNIITEVEDPELYLQLISYEIGVGNGFYLIKHNVINEENHKELFDKIIDGYLNEEFEDERNTRFLYEFLDNKIITKERNEQVWYDIIYYLLNNGDYFYILKEKFITRENDPELFYEILNSLDDENINNLINNQIINKDDIKSILKNKKIEEFEDKVDEFENFESPNSIKNLIDYYNNYK